MKVANGTLTGAYICHLGQISLTDSTLIQSCGEVSSVAAQGSGNPNTGVSVGGNTYITVKTLRVVQVQPIIPLQMEWEHSGVLLEIVEVLGLHILQDMVFNQVVDG